MHVGYHLLHTQVEGHLREISLLQEELLALQASQAQTERQEEDQLRW
jgi:hypothetical protein